MFASFYVKMLRWSVLLWWLHGVSSQGLNPSVDVKALSELSLDKLLLVQNSFKLKEGEVLDISQTQEETKGPVALALHAKTPTVNRGGYDDHYHEEEQKSKVQNIFQLSITSLAFLSFGGYLLCLIVQAIKGKQMAENNAVATKQQVLAALLGQMTRRPTRLRRRPNNRRPNTYTKNRRPVRHKREVIWPNADPEKMYYALVTLSEAYTNYHTTDYKHFNQTAF